MRSPKAAAAGLVVAVEAAGLALGCAHIARHADAATVKGPETLTVYDQRAEPSSKGPIYDLPKGYTSYAVTEKEINRAYILIEGPRGIAVVPRLDGDGEQVVVSRTGD